MTGEPPRDPAALEFVLGAWKGFDAMETWTRVDGVLIGVSLSRRGGFEVLQIDDHDGFLRYVARPGGGAPTVFACVSGTAEGATFTNPEHDFPQSIRYSRHKRRLEAAIGRIGEPEGPIFRFHAVEPTPSLGAENADRRFAEAVRTGGVEAWVAAFHPDGRLWRDGGHVALPAMEDAMRPVLEGGALAWAPIASGAHPWADDQAWTVGTWTWTAEEGGVREGWYVTLWRLDPVRGWLAWYDVGETTGP